MEVLFVLIGLFILSLVVVRFIKKEFDYSLAGRIAMSIMLLFTASGHFMFGKGMELMMPDFLPFKRGFVYLTGILEISAAIGLLIPRFQRLTSWLLIIFFIMILPANILGAINKIDIYTGEKTGPGIEYLWFRIPMQVLFIGWVYFFGIKMNSKEGIRAQM